MLADHPLSSTSRRPPRANGLYWIPFASFFLKNLISHRHFASQHARQDRWILEQAKSQILGTKPCQGLIGSALAPALERLLPDLSKCVQVQGFVLVLLQW